MKKIASTILAISLAACVSVIGSTTPLRAQQKVYEIGALFPLSGSNAIYGELNSRSVNAAVEYVNRTMAARMGGTIHITYADGQALPQPSVIGMRQLVDVNKVPAVFTAFSGVSRALAPIGSREKVLVIQAGAGDPAVLTAGPYLINVQPPTSQEMKLLGPYVANTLKLKKIAVMYQDNPLGDDSSDAVQEIMKGLGATIVTTQGFPASATAFSSQVAAIRAAGPDGIFIFSTGDQQVQILKALRDGGVTATILSYDGFDEPQVVSLPQAQGAYISSIKLDFNLNNAPTKEFNAAFAKLKATPSVLDANFFNATIMLANAIAWCNSRHLPADGEHLRDAIGSLKTFNGVGTTFTITLTPTGSIPSMPISIQKLENGKWVTVATGSS